MKHIGMFELALSVAGCAHVPAASNQSGRTQPFILGADITFLLEDEAAGAVYYDHGMQRDFFQILKDNQFNYVRVPSVVEPTRAFSRGDLEHVKILAKRAKLQDFNRETHEPRENRL
jgi:arabinogalactan endo-1,4-beta-galactosidase